MDESTANAAPLGPPGRRSRSRRWLAAIACALMLAGCGGGGDKGKSGNTTAETAAEKAKNEPKQPEVSEKGKQWGGWRWKGKRDDCFFVVGNRCFNDKAKACKAAKCSAKSCQITGGGPAKVTCKK